MSAETRDEAIVVVRFSPVVPEQLQVHAGQRPLRARKLLHLLSGTKTPNLTLLSCQDRLFVRYGDDWLLLLHRAETRIEEKRRGEGRRTSSDVAAQGKSSKLS